MTHLESLVSIEMSVLLPNIGITQCERSEALLKEYPENIVGSFWIMGGACGFNIPSWWIDVVLEDNQAAGIIDLFENGAFDGGHENPLYSGFCIIVVANKDNPANFSYIIENPRMWEAEGIRLLEIMAKYNIPAITEVTYPESFLWERSGYNELLNEQDVVNLNTWTVQVWEDYCSFLIAKHGQRMLANFYRKNNQIRDEVKLLIEDKTKPLVLTEGETDPLYIKTALKLLGETEILRSVDIEWVGSSIGKGKSINTGDGGLNNTRNVLISNPKFLNMKVLLIYDCDTKQCDEDCNEYLKIRRIPLIPDRKIKKGIENLFPSHLFKPEFYTWKQSTGDYGEEKRVQEFQKMRFCKWVCEERKNPKDFQDFKVIIDFIKTCLGEISF